MSDEVDHYSILDAISGIFIGYGGRIAPSNTDPIYLRVVVEDLKIAVGYSITDQQPGTAPIVDFLSLTEDTFFHYHVFITNHHLSEDVVDFSRDNDVILLGRNDLEHELGKAHLGSLEMFSHPRIHLDEREVNGSGEEQLVRRTLDDIQQSVAGETVDERPELILVLKQYQEKNTPLNEEPEHAIDTLWASEDTGQNGSQSLTEEPAQQTSGMILIPKLQLTDLPELCTAITPLTNTQTELIPYFLFTYSCTIIEEGSGVKKARTGLMAVNGITMGVEEWEPGFSTVSELPMDYIRLDPRTDGKVAKDLALNVVVQVNTRVMNVKVEENGSTVHVKRKSYPDTSSIELSPEGVYFFPHWHVRSDTGSMFVDAVNGEVISTYGDEKGWNGCQ